MKKYNLIIVLFIALFGTISCSKTDLFEYPDSDSDQAEITNFSILDEAGVSVSTNIEIESEAGRIFVTVAAGTDKTKLVPRATVSEGVIVEPVMGVYTDFSTNKTYTLIAGNRVDKKEWTVVVSE